MSRANDHPAVRGVVPQAIEFMTAPASPRPLSVFRIGIAAVLLAEAFAIAGNLLDLYGRDGLIQWSTGESLIPVGLPRLSWFTRALAPLGLGHEGGVRLVFLAYVASLAALLVGWRTRPAAVVAWLIHLALKASGSAGSYGVDEFANIALFYCVWMPVGHDLSADRLSGRVSGAPSPAAGLALRVLQAHLCLVYGSSGILKASGHEWWDGESIWRAVMQPETGCPVDFGWLARWPWAAALAGWATLLFEAGFPILVWPPRTRAPWVLATIGLHLGIAFALGLASFSAIMIVFDVAAFLIPAGPSTRPSSVGPFPWCTCGPSVRRDCRSIRRCRRYARPIRFELDSTLPHRLSLLYGGYGEKTHLLQARAGDDRRRL